MIRAVLKKGKIHPLEKLPAHWREGEELFIEGGSPSDDPAEIEKWFREFEKLSEGLSDTDHERMQAALDEQKRLGKESRRRKRRSSRRNVLAGSLRNRIGYAAS